MKLAMVSFWMQISHLPAFVVPPVCFISQSTSYQYQLSGGSSIKWILATLKTIYQYQLKSMLNLKYFHQFISH